MQLGITISLGELAAAADDPRILVLDVRTRDQRAARPLDDGAFTVVCAPPEALSSNLLRVATLVGARHVVVVDDQESGAVAAARLLRTVEVDCAALEGGLGGWTAFCCAQQPCVRLPTCVGNDGPEVV